ncbi:MAG: ScyD/ScyE family protein [Trueperaceae bacterium]|nr:ScyD/ScyE family protein [Trueperaceae bacterium]
MLGVIAWFGTAFAQEVVAEGLNNPMGVLAMPDGSVWVVDSGVGGDQEIETVDPNTGEATIATVGMTSQVVRIGPDGQQSVRAMLPSVHVGQEFTGGSRLARLGTQVFVTSGGWLGELGPDPMPMMAAVVRVDGDEPSVVASTWDIEAASNPDGFVLDSHPYGIVGGSDGNLYVADAGANTILRVNPRTGAVELVAVMDGVPSPMPNPARDGAQETDPVPTGITQTRDGGMYVASLPGFPFLPGSAGVHALSSDGSVTNLAGGLTVLTDLQAAPDGTLYAVTLAEFTEQGPTPGSGAVTRVALDGSTEVVLDGLMFPTAIAFAQNGDAYLSVNGIGAPGSGMLVRYPGLGVR